MECTCPTACHKNLGENLEVWFKLILNVFIKLIVVVNRRTWLE